MSSQTQNPEPKQSEVQKTPTNRLQAWLLAGAWGSGTAIYGWLLIGLFTRRKYAEIEHNPCEWIVALLIASAVGAAIGYTVFKRAGKNNSDSSSGQLFRIVIAVLPALFVVSALATLVLTLTTYNGYWVEARQGLATAFAALIAAVGVVVSVAVSYRTGEEDRKLQQTLEDRKNDAETIKALNDRLHEILPRRNSKKERENIQLLPAISSP